MRCDVHCFLAGGGVEDEQSFLRFDEIAEANQLLNEWLVDLEAAGGVEDERVAIVGFGEVESAACDLEDVGLAFVSEVVLPELWRAVMRTQLGLPLSWMLALEEPRSSTSSA